MNPPIKHRLLLNIAIVLLVLFNGMQLYGIFSQQSTSTISSAKKENDTMHVPIQINVLNGCGVNGVGNTMTKFCRQLGYDVVEMGNYKTFDLEHSIVIDRSGKTNEAQQLASQLGIERKNVIQQFNNDQMVSVSVVIGRDFKLLTPWK
ncbi:MAG: LytR C-terminal domain-containing protein [Bacteroidota bacterium]